MDARSTVTIGPGKPKQRHIEPEYRSRHGIGMSPQKVYATNGNPCLIAEIVTGREGATCPFSDADTSLEDQAQLCAKCISVKTALRHVEEPKWPETKLIGKQLEYSWDLSASSSPLVSP